MKYLNSLVIIVLLSVPCVFAQTVQPEFPNYANWPVVYSIEKMAVHNGNIVKIKADDYVYVDYGNATKPPKRFSLRVINDEQNNPWFSVLLYELGEKLNEEKIVTRERHIYLFEKNTKGWAYIKEFDIIPTVNADINDFIRTKYGLIFN